MCNLYSRPKGQQAILDLARAQVDRTGNSAIDALDRLIVGGESFGQVLGDITRQLARMVLQAALLGQGPLASLFGFGGTGGGVGGLVGLLFGGARAAGGPVSTGRSYLVGEKGPEMFVPNSSGAIVPNDMVRGGGGGVAVTFGDTLIDARNSSMSEAQFRSILAENNKQVLSMVPAAVQKARSTRDLDRRR
ncbi:hypothetical protein [Phreatobacter sp.]|uniref:hypothetical protein n=1 Tax=Phreatobacter sp. TaxID=1966341 RepID=UPI003F6EB19A